MVREDIVFSVENKDLIEANTDAIQEFWKEYGKVEAAAWKEYDKVSEKAFNDFLQEVIKLLKETEQVKK